MHRGYIPVKYRMHTCVEEWTGAQVAVVVHRIAQSTILARLRLTRIQWHITQRTYIRQWS